MTATQIGIKSLSTAPYCHCNNSSREQTVQVKEMSQIALASIFKIARLPDYSSKDFK